MFKSTLSRVVLVFAAAAAVLALALAVSMLLASPTQARERVAQPISMAQQAPAAEEGEGPRRGCLACHVLVDPARGNYTLAFEAHERAEARGREHPSIAPDGTSLKSTDQTGVEPCLLCHRPASATGTNGVGAPLALRSIVHPAHMFSVPFKERYNGSCFTCHDVRGDGRFVLIGDKMDVNEKGVPNIFPVPGLIAPSEG